MAYTTIDDPSAYFKVQLYTGNGSTNAITFNDTDTDMQPDWVWLKNRNSSGHDHFLFDAANGVQKFLSSNDTGALAAADSSYLTAFNTDGFTLGSSDGMNENTITFVSWNWKANGAGSSNTDGSINTTKTSANTTSGFSISTYTGTGIGSGTATVGHGLGAVPSLVIQKRTGGAANWGMYHKSIGNTGSIALNSDDATNTQTDYWGDTTPTSALVTVGPNFAISGGNVLFSFIEKQGFSKFGSYLGNGNADGAFVYTGFKPAFVMMKGTSASKNWIMYDNKRLGFNVSNSYLYANESNNESDASHIIDLVSNGFKCRANSSDTNTSGSTYIFLAFAESPFVNSSGVPTTAR